MSLKARVKNAVKTAFKRIGDLAETGTLSRLNTGYSTDTGAVTDNPTTSEFKCVEMTQDIAESLGAAMRTAQTKNVTADTLRVLANKQGLTLEPSTEDKVTLRERDWALVKVEPLFDAAYIFTLRSQYA